MMKNLFLSFPMTYILLLFIIPQQVSGQTKNGDIYHYRKQIEQHKKAENFAGAAKYLNKAGYLAWRKGDLKDAIAFFRESIEMNDKTGNINAIKTLYSNIGLIYTDLKSYEQAIEMLNRSLDASKSQKDAPMIMNNLINLALANQGLNRYEDSNRHLKNALSLAREQNNIKIMQTCYSSMAENYRYLDNKEEAYRYFELASSLKQELNREKFQELEEVNQQVKEQNQQTENALKQKQDTLQQVKKVSEEKELQIQLLNKEKRLQELLIKEANAKARAKQRTIVFLGSGLGIFIFLSGIIFWQFRQKKKANVLLGKRAEKINLQKEEIEKQKKKITSSIQYARRIQGAVLPPLDEISEVLPHHFIYYKPRDIVSGDFYWFTEKEGVAIIAVADCTGHGVPGAFMSMMGTAYLNEIVNKIGINKHIRTLKANEILNQLRDNVIKSLHQTEKNVQKDGMDMALCIIDFDNQHLQFAGANNPMLMVRNGELTEIRGDRLPIGYHKSIKPFTNHETNSKPGDVIYLLSDGYIDQFGGEKGSKFLLKRLKQILREIHREDFSRQYDLLDEQFNNWKGTNFQVDDVLVVGFKIPPATRRKVSFDDINWQQKRILIAEDTDLNYFLLVEALKKTDAQVFRARDGKEAVGFCRNHPLDLILMDLNMPEMSGYDAVKEIRNFKKDLPIIAQTAQGQPGDKERCIQVGCNDYIAKPIDLKEFIGKLSRYLG